MYRGKNVLALHNVVHPYMDVKSVGHTLLGAVYQPPLCIFFDKPPPKMYVQ